MYPRAELPLQVRDGVSYLQWGAQVRPDQPLAQYQLRARIGRYDVDVVAYFGVSHPTEAQLDAAQRQLDGLVIRSASHPQRASARSSSAAPAVAVIDRTYACSTTFLGGLYELKNRAHAGIRGASGWAEAPVRRRWQRGMGSPGDGSAERAQLLTRVDHGRNPVARHDRRRQRRGLLGARRRDDRRERIGLPPVDPPRWR